MRQHKIGDRVRVDCSVSADHGKECTVISGLVPGSDEGRDYMGYRVDLPCGDPACEWCQEGGPIFEPHELIPLDDPNEKLTWEDMAGIWQPQSVPKKVTVEVEQDG